MIYLAGTDFSHLTNDELIKGIQALKLPDYIRSKAYGVDVRETLAQMTEMTIQLGVNMGLSPDDALKWARKLQETVSQSEFDSWVATLLDGGPSIFMNTLNELKTTYPNGAAGVALVRETDPAKIYVWNGSAWEDFGDYQGIEIKDGTVTTTKLVAKAVTPIKTTFVDSDKNFTGNFVENFAVMGSAASPVLFKNVAGRGSYIAKVEGGRTYTVNVKGGNVFRVATSKSYPLNGETPNWFSGTIDGNKPRDGYTLQLDDDEEYIVVFVTSDYVNNMPEDFTVKAHDEPLERVKINLANGSISANQTDFAKSHKNLIGDLVEGLSISGSAIEGHRFSEHETAGSYIAKVEGGKTYTVNVEGGNRFRIATSIDYPIADERANRFLGSFDNEPIKEFTFTLTEEENYVVIYATFDLENHRPIHAKLTEVHETSDSVEINLSKNSVSPDVLKKSKENLIGRFVENFAPMGSAADGVYFRNQEGRGSYITKLEGGRTYTVNVKGGNVFRVATSKSYPLNGEVPNWYSGTIDGNKPKDGYTFTMPDGDNYAVIFVSSDINAHYPEYAVLEEGYEIIDGVKIDLAKGSVTPEMLSSTINTRLGVVTDNVVGNYKKENPLTFNHDYFFSGGRTAVSNIYLAWDELVDDYPEYVSREEMWREPSQNIPVYKYTFKPPMPHYNVFDLKMFKTLVLGGVHGELYASVTILNFFHDLVKEWETSSPLEMMRWNVQYDVFPIYNPIAVLHQSRINGSGTDLNSNLPPNWKLRDHGTQYYSGPSVLSAFENQQFDAYLDSMERPYDFAVDTHNSSAYENQDGFVTYTRTNNYGVNRMLYGVANQTNSWIRKELKDVFGDNNTHEVQLAPIDNTGSMFSYLQYKGIPNTLFEMSYPGEVVNEENTLLIGQNIFGNILMNAVKHHDLFSQKNPPRGN